jgi:hypothetical protein
MKFSLSIGTHLNEWNAILSENGRRAIFSAGSFFLQDPMYTSSSCFSSMPPGGAVRILDFGCGQTKEPGAVGLDVNPATYADVPTDVSGSPLPIFPDSFDHTVVRHIVEHVEDPIRFMEELQSATRDGNEIEGGGSPHTSRTLARSPARPTGATFPSGS